MQTMDSQTIGVVATFMINAVAIIWCIRETFVRHRQTQELQKSNATLQGEVHKLSVHLNQEIVRLNRLNNLTTELYQSVARQSYRFGLTIGSRSKDASRGIVNDNFINEISDCIATLEGSILEMKAIAIVIGDSELPSLINELRAKVPTFDVEESRDKWLKRQITFGQQATAVHEKVYKLLQEVTDTAMSETNPASPSPP